jgi:hypothetical protein
MRTVSSQLAAAHMRCGTAARRLLALTSAIAIRSRVLPRMAADLRHPYLGEAKSGSSVHAKQHGNSREQNGEEVHLPT